MLWPTTASGLTPCDRHRAARATWTAKFAGWASQVSLIRETDSSAVISSMRDQSANSRIARSQAATASRKTGSFSSSWRPMPHHCGPIPVKTQACLRSAASRARPWTTRGWGSPRSWAASASSRESRVE